MRKKIKGIKMARQLNEKDILDIYYAEGSTRELAKLFDTSVSTVSRIKSLKYDKYKKIIEQSKKVEDVKVEDEVKISDDTKKVIEANPKDKNEMILNKIKELNYDIVAGDVLAILSNYFNPLILKFIYDNLLEEENFKQLINQLIDKIKEVNTAEFYAETIKQIILAILLQTMKEEYVKKLFD